MKFCWEIGNKKKPSGVKGIEIRVLKLFFSKGEVSIALSHEIKRHLLLGRKAMINARLNEAQAGIKLDCQEIYQ